MIGAWIALLGAGCAVLAAYFDRRADAEFPRNYPRWIAASDTMFACAVLCLVAAIVAGPMG